jgi:hypothetical protein
MLTAEQVNIELGNREFMAECRTIIFLLALANILIVGTGPCQYA